MNKHTIVCAVVLLTAGYGLVAMELNQSNSGRVPARRGVQFDSGRNQVYAFNNDSIATSGPKKELVLKLQAWKKVVEEWSDTRGYKKDIDVIINAIRVKPYTKEHLSTLKQTVKVLRNQMGLGISYDSRRPFYPTPEPIEKANKVIAEINKQLGR